MSTVGVDTAFFQYLFGNDTGYICIATTLPPTRRETFTERYFKWPKDKELLADHISLVTPTHNIYFCVNLLSESKRVKANAMPTNLVWADLDTCAPDKLDIPPQCVIESSPGRYQAIWRMNSKVDPLIAENYSRRIAYQYAELGVDKSGHDLTQLLRVPGTFNFKYGIGGETPGVELLTDMAQLLPREIFDALPAMDDFPLEEFIDAPDAEFVPPAESVIYAFQEKLKTTAFARYYSEEPVADWSRVLWRLINTCLEVGMSAEETYSVARSSKCNNMLAMADPNLICGGKCSKPSYHTNRFKRFLASRSVF